MKKVALQELSRAKKMQLYNNFNQKSVDDKVRLQSAHMHLVLITKYMCTLNVPEYSIGCAEEADGRVQHVQSRSSGKCSVQLSQPVARIPSR